ncbi:LysR family transcriptional regulator [Pollutimonas subterranea]|uniref:LysR family transcriptional regulator n=1 Tax=Pollutimonas subterranea TaxID=2045210 RepID=A0A2N4U6L9_9BURK|nr:LysR substrate-binding domain-containing protein [Pollutimonas subterranea]PLC50639.1 LysR family transcriptional regulator [Pollutimonas subterranea]
MSISEIMKLDGRVLVAFCVVAEELHFGRAAARLSISQPPLSRQIKQLEEWVGTALFLRSTRTVALTAAGVVMYQQARRICADLEYMVQTTRQVARGDAGSLSIGITPSAANSPLVESLHVFRLRHPTIELDLREMDSVNMTAALLAHELDVALMRPIVQSDKIRSMTVYSEPIGLVSRADHVFAEDTVTLKEIARHPLIGYEESVSPYFAEMVRGIFARENTMPNIVQKSRLPSILTLVEAGVGVAIAPASMAQARAASLTWRSISAINLPVAQVIVAVAREASNPVINSFVGSLLGRRTRGSF